MKKLIYFILLTSLSLNAQEIDYTKLKGAYLGQKLPNIEPELFAPGIVSTENGNHSSPTLTPDGKEIYWSMKNKIWYSIETQKGWSIPKAITFTDDPKYLFDNPFISPDGCKLFFTKYPYVKDEYQKEMIWFSIREGKDWSEPIALSPVVNEMSLHWSISVSKKGNLYFGSSSDIYCSKYIDGKYSKPAKLSSTINTEYLEMCPCIAADESYIIFNRLYETPKNSGIFISFKDKEGKWKEPVFIVGGSPEKGGVSPRITPDEKFLFFVNGSKGTKWMLADFLANK